MKTKYKFAKRLTELRKLHKLTQSDLCVILTDLLKRETVLSVPTISSWELGRREPSLEVQEALCTYYNVSLSYLRGITDNIDATDEDVILENSKYTEKHIDDIYNIRKEIKITAAETLLFDGKPVFIEFKDYSHQNQWAIVNRQKKMLILKNGYISVYSPNINKIYINEPDYISMLSVSGECPISMHQVMKRSKNRPLWVEMTSHDDNIRSQYNGWYKHNENMSCLINVSNGLTLPYTGIGISFNVYSNHLKTRINTVE